MLRCDTVHPILMAGKLAEDMMPHGGSLPSNKVNLMRFKIPFRPRTYLEVGWQGSRPMIKT